MVVIERWLLILLLFIPCFLPFSAVAVVAADVGSGAQADQSLSALEASLKKVRAEHRAVLSKRQAQQRGYERAERRYRARILAFERALLGLKPNGMKNNWPILEKAKPVTAAFRQFKPILERYRAVYTAEQAVSQRLAVLEAKRRSIDVSQKTTDAQNVALSKGAGPSDTLGAKIKQSQDAPSREGKSPESLRRTLSSKGPSESLAPKATSLWPNVATEPTRLQATYARREWQRLSALPKAQSPIGRVKMRSKRLGTETFTYLGETFYALALSLSSGSYDAKIFDHDYRIDIPSGRGKKEYQLLLDVKSLVRPQLHVFPKSVLRDSSRVGGR